MTGRLSLRQARVLLLVEASAEVMTGSRRVLDRCWRCWPWEEAAVACHQSRQPRGLATERGGDASPLFLPARNWSSCSLGAWGTAVGVRCGHLTCQHVEHPASCCHASCCPEQMPAEAAQTRRAEADARVGMPHWTAASENWSLG